MLLRVSEPGDAAEQPPTKGQAPSVGGPPSPAKDRLPHDNNFPMFLLLFTGFRIVVRGMPRHDVFAPLPPEICFDFTETKCLLWGIDQRLRNAHFARANPRTATGKSTRHAKL